MVINFSCLGKNYTLSIYFKEYFTALPTDVVSLKE